MLKLKLQTFGHLMHRADSLEKTLMLGKIQGRRRRGRQRMRWFGSITDSTDMNLNKLQEMVKDRGAWGHTGSQTRGHGRVPEQQICSLPEKEKGIFPWGHKQVDTAEWLNSKSARYQKKKKVFFQLIEVGEPNKNTKNMLMFQAGVNGE